MGLVTVAVLFLLLLPNVITSLWVLQGTNVAYEATWKRGIVGLTAAVGTLWWGMMLLGALLMPFEHQNQVRAAAANTIHPAGHA
jgi:hypothetical protein